MEKYIDAFTNSFLGTLNWTYKSILFEVPWYTNYFWGLIVISLSSYGVLKLFSRGAKINLFLEKILAWMHSICFSTFSFLQL